MLKLNLNNDTIMKQDNKAPLHHRYLINVISLYELKHTTLLFKKIEPLW